jgi:hypothetical protein
MSLLIELLKGMSDKRLDELIRLAEEERERRESCNREYKRAREGSMKE